MLKYATFHVEFKHGVLSPAVGASMLHGKVRAEVEIWHGVLPLHLLISDQCALRVQSAVNRFCTALPGSHLLSEC